METHYIQQLQAFLLDNQIAQRCFSEILIEVFD